MERNSWKNITLICGNHPGEEVPMEIHMDREGSSPFYACPNYVPARLRASENDCTNRISVAMQEKLVILLNERARNENSPLDNNLTGLRWSSGGVDYRVLEHKNGKFKVLVLNKKEIAK